MGSEQEVKGNEQYYLRIKIPIATLGLSDSKLEGFGV